MNKVSTFGREIVIKQICIAIISPLKNGLIKQFLPLAAFALLTISVPFAVHAKEYVAVGINFPPLMFEKDGKTAGFYFDMLKLIQKKMPDIEIKTKLYPTKRMLKVIQETPNAFALGIARTPEREPDYKWAGPSIATTMGLFKLKKRSDILIKSEADIKRYKTGTCRGYAFNEILKGMGVPESKIEVVSSDVQNVRKLHKNRIALMATLDIVFAEILKQTEYKWNEFEMAYVMGKSDMYYAFNKSIEDSLVMQFQDAIDKIRQTEEYDNLVKRYIPK